MNESEFLKKLQEAFAMEAEEHFAMLGKTLAELEQSSVSDSTPLIELIFREAHSLKGAARAVNRSDIEALCQSLESLFALWRRDPAHRQTDHFKLCSEAMELLEGMLRLDHEMSVSNGPVADILEMFKAVTSRIRENVHPQRIHVQQEELPRKSQNTAPETPMSASRLDVSEAQSVKSEENTSAEPMPESRNTRAGADEQRAANVSTATESRPIQDAPLRSSLARDQRVVKDTVRVPVKELEAVYRQIEELGTVQFMLGGSNGDLRRVIDQCRAWLHEYQLLRQQTLDYKHDDHATAVHVEERYEKLLHFVKWTVRQIEGIEQTITSSIEDGAATMYIMDSLSESLMEHAKQLLLLPFSLLTDPLQAMLARLARDVGKRVDFHIHGQDIRIDKRILEELKDPLIHLLRNCLDHGIEEQSERVRMGKAPNGTLRLDIRTARDNRIEVLLSDDGRGIDVELLRQSAVESGTISERQAAALSEREALELMFHPGVSTNSEVTSLSGRGVGMSVVRENISTLGGEITVSTSPGQGSTFCMRLPVSLSNARGVIVRASGRLYIVPLQYVVRGITLHRDDVAVLDGMEVVEFEGKTIALHRLEDILEMPASANSDHSSRATILLLSHAANTLAIDVGEILWEQDVVVKPLPAPISRVRTIAGATLLGTGELVPVLHIPDLFDSARGTQRSEAAHSQAIENSRVSRLLVVDDSITSRVLLHDILVANGYHVQTAIDGIDALTHLREHDWDLLVSDVEMPRMNGFELTKTIRNDEKLRELPVILVTGLESQEDRERGFDVGANAYITKSGFDQSNLLETISRLL